MQSDQIVCIDDQNPYFSMIRGTWGHQLREVFESIDDPQWGGAEALHPLRVASTRFPQMKKIADPGEKIV